MNQLQHIVNTLKRRQQIIEAVPISLFEKQMEVVNNPSRRKIVVCSRRSGKTILSLYYLLKTAIENPGVKLAYLALSYKAAKNIAWDEFKKMLRNIIPPESFKESELKIILPNKSTIYLFGADKPQTIEAIRGQKFKLVIVDECASYSQLRYLVEDVIYPTLIDLSGTVMLIGTPGPPHGFFYESSLDNSGFTLFRWLMDDNPHLPRESIAEVKSRYSPNSPAYLREIMAEFAAAEDAVFNYSLKNRIGEFKPENIDDWNYVVGLDFGVRDDSAIVLLGYSRFSKDIYVLDAFSKPEMPIVDIANQIARMTEGIAQNRLTYVYDSAATVYAKELSERFEFSMTPAKKQDKAGNIARANSLLYQGLIKIADKAHLLLNEFDILTWANTKKEQWKDGVPDHVTDAFLYALKYIYSSPTVEKKPEQPKNEIDAWERSLINKSLENKNEKDKYRQLWGSDYDSFDTF